jgi:hypothetical protein
MLGMNGKPSEEAKVRKSVSRQYGLIEGLRKKAKY